MTRPHLCTAFACALLFLAPAPAQTQSTSPAQPASPSQPDGHNHRSLPDYTLDVRTGLVIEDASVTDKQGDAVTALPRTAFHLWDNGTEQHLQSFAETAAAPATSTRALPPGTWSNASLYLNQGTTVAMLIDNYSMALPDQMYLRLQVQRYLNTMAPGTHVALFRTGRSGAPILIQPLTSDRAQLLQAVNSIVPAMLRSIGNSYGNAVAQLENLAELLRPVPGRKALLWFSGNFPLYLDPEYCNAVGPVTPSIQSSEKVVDCNAMNDMRKEAFVAMQQARIAVYPIDVRGVLVLPGLTRPAAAGGMVGGVSNTPNALPQQHTSALLKVSGQYDVMDQLADATGGRAFYSNNALAEAMTSAVLLATTSYTLSYRPEPGIEDGTWHKIRLTVDGPYTVHYRTGYFAAEAPAPRRPLLQANDVKSISSATSSTPVLSEVDASAKPILFRAHVERAGNTSGKAARFHVEYAIPSQQLAFNAAADGTEHARVRLIALAYNTQGDVLGNAVDTLETKFTPTQMSVATRIGTPGLQSVQATKGADYLLLAVEDLNTHHIGTLQVPLHALNAQLTK